MLGAFVAPEETQERRAFPAACEHKPRGGLPELREGADGSEYGGEPSEAVPDNYNNTDVIII